VKNISCQVIALTYEMENIQLHASYLPTKNEIHLSLNKGCMGKSVKIHFEHW
jgi:hypothetical protein